MVDNNDKNIEQLFNTLLKDKNEREIMNIIINEDDTDEIIKKMIKGSKK